MIDSQPSVVPVRPQTRLPWTTVLALAAFSALTVYATSVSLHTIDIDTGVKAYDMSLREYNQVIAGTRGFPYQWRVLGAYLVYWPERLTGLPPHGIDIVVKVLLLWASSLMLFLFSRFYTSEAGAFAVVGFYQLLNVPAFTDEQYRIYFTNDYAMLACFFGAVYLIRTERYVGAAILTFIGSWAKETMMLVPVMLGFNVLRTRRLSKEFVMTAIAFAIPTVILRSIYPAPLAKWAWWDMVFANVPFLQTSMHEFRLTIKNNIKVALFYNVFWLLAARAVRASADRFPKDLAATMIFYLIIAYPVIYIRELRHFLPLAIVVLPMAISAIERQAAADAARSPHPAP